MLVYLNPKRTKYLLILGLLLFLLFPGFFFFILGLSLFIVLVPIALGIIGFWVYFWQMRKAIREMQAKGGRSPQQKSERIMKDVN